MTSLVCWLAIDSRAIASIYIASDSRITADGRVLCDTARKVFACRRRPDVLGYYGNADAPPVVLARLVSALDARPVAGEQNAWNRAQFLVDGLNRDLPLPHGHPYGQTKVVYASRDGEGHTSAEFAVFEIHVVEGRWDFGTLISSKAREEEDAADRYRAVKKEDVVFAEGSGAGEVRKWRERWVHYHASLVPPELKGSTRTRTSRGVFSALCSSLHSGGDPLSGGAPQLAVIHQKGAAMSLGVIWKNQRFYEGASRTESESLALETRWHDSLFQLCSPATMQVLEEAALHGAPTTGLDLERPPEGPSKRKERRQKAATRSQVERDSAREAHRKRFLK